MEIFFVEQLTHSVEPGVADVQGLPQIPSQRLSDRRHDQRSVAPDVVHDEDEYRDSGGSHRSREDFNEDRE